MSFTKKKSHPSAPSNIKKLGIEKPEKRVPAPDFTLKDLSGKSVGMQALRGRVVFLNFWATWCVPCRDEMPTMEKLHREFKDQGLEIVAVNFRENKKEVNEFFAELGLTFTTLLDADFTVFQKYSVWSLPMTHIINRKGQLVGKAVGYREWDSKEARAFLCDLLQEKIR